MLEIILTAWLMMFPLSLAFFGSVIGVAVVRDRIREVRSIRARQWAEEAQ